MTVTLTRKQKELLLFIDRRIKEDGLSPSFDEMRDAVGLASKSGIHRLVTALEERGYIRRLAHRARALEVLKLPPELSGSVEQQLSLALVMRDSWRRIAEQSAADVERLREEVRLLNLRLARAGRAA